jgi:hypothetical protein
MNQQGSVAVTIARVPPKTSHLAMDEVMLSLPQ